MIYFFVLLIIIYLINVKLNFKGLNKDYMSKYNTTILNGVFVMIVFFSHFLSYNPNLDSFSVPLKFITSKIGQLMVTPFLFYSGFGIYESIKKNKVKYIDSFFKKRFVITLLNFMIAVMLFLILGLILSKNYPIKTIVLSFIGLESLGNSNWYMFTIFNLYLFVLFSFKLFQGENKNNLIIITILSLVYIYFINIFKDSFWVDTVLCFVFGMWYSFFKDKIDKFVMKNFKSYIGTLIITFLIFIIFYHEKTNIYIHNLLSLTFIFIINLISMKVTSNSKILLFLGNHVFWIYILQRIPMIIFEGKLNIYVYFFSSFIITLILSVILKNITSRLWKKIFSF